MWNCLLEIVLPHTHICNPLILHPIASLDENTTHTYTPTPPACHTPTLHTASPPHHTQTHTHLHTPPSHITHPSHIPPPHPHIHHIPYPLTLQDAPYHTTHTHTHPTTYRCNQRTIMINL